MHTPEKQETAAVESKGPRPSDLLKVCCVLRSAFVCVGCLWFVLLCSIVSLMYDVAVLFVQVSAKGIDKRSTFDVLKMQKIKALRISGVSTAEGQKKNPELRVLS